MAPAQVSRLGGGFRLPGPGPVPKYRLVWALAPWLGTARVAQPRWLQLAPPFSWAPLYRAPAYLWAWRRARAVTLLRRRERTVPGLRPVV